MKDETVVIVSSIERFSDHLLMLWNSFLGIAPSLLLGLLIFIIFFFLAKPLSYLILRPIGYLSSSVLVHNVARRGVSIFIMLLGLYIFLSFAGLTQAALAVVSGTGFLGIIIGFAFRDIAENFISSLLLSIQRPFRLGDVIEVQGLKGVVNKMTARGTTLVDFDGNHLQIPNATIYKNVIKNFSANPWIRGSFAIGVGYDSSIQLARDTILKMIAQESAVLKEPDAQVLVDSLGSSTINLVVSFWIDGHKYELIKVASVLMRKSVRSLESVGVSMPDDAREVIFPQGIPIVKLAQQDGLLDSGKGEVQNITVEQDVSEVTNEELESDTQDIIDQANNSRDPEEGQNII